MSAPAGFTLGDLIRASEGLRLKPYDDATGREIRPGSSVVGHITIGYGLALDVDGITPAEAELLRASREQRAVQAAALAVGASFWPVLAAARQAALADMAYQLGPAGSASSRPCWRRSAPATGTRRQRPRWPAPGRARRPAAPGATP